MNVSALQSRVRGPLIVPSDPDYDEVRALYNAMIDKRPAAILSCLDASDVQAGVRFAAETGTLLAVRGGGHNGPGLGSCDGGLVLDLGAMNTIEVDPTTGRIDVGPGCRQGEVDAAAHPYGLAVPAGIIANTGVAGLTLGGGHGYLSRRYGLTIDNLVEADMVLADGRQVTCSAAEHPDLFWAIRGGGGNFGVVTRFRYQARPVSMVYGGPVFFPIEDAATVMAWYREWLPAAPREMFAFLGLKTVPDVEAFPAETRKRRICALIFCWSGPVAQGEAAVDAALRGLPAPMLRGTAAMPFPALQSLFDPLLPPGMQWYWKGDFVRTLSDEAIGIHLEHGSNSPTPLSLMHLYPIDGAVHDVPRDATAWAHRDVVWSMVIAGIDPNPAAAPSLTKWSRDYWEALRGHTVGGAYINFMMEEGAERIQATYGDNHPRLRQIKSQYDPSNLFRVNQNIAPATIEGIEGQVLDRSLGASPKTNS